MHGGGMKKKPSQLYYKLIVDGKIFDIFPSFQIPSHYRRLLKLEGVSLSPSNHSEYEAFLIKRPRP